MSLETELQATIKAAIEKAFAAKDSTPGMPIFGLLVGAPFMKSREATLIDSLLGMLIGSLIDRGDTDAQIMAKCKGTLEAIRSAMADPSTTQHAKAIVAAMDKHKR